MSVGVITNFIVIPPTTILIQLFRKSKPKKSNFEKLKDKIKLVEVRNEIQSINETKDEM